jgi:cytochrome subunit of sulfide dehydrogenase
MECYSDRSTDLRSGIRSRRTNVIRCVGVASGAVGLLIAVNSLCLAQGAVSPPGRLLASSCAQCHGTTDAAPGFDRLTGKSASKLLRKMHKYQSGAEGEGIMTHHAMGYTEQQLRDLVEWLSQQR